MSALGKKRTHALHQPMSALPPKADICSALSDVRFGPIADIQKTRGPATLDDAPGQGVNEAKLDRSLVSSTLFFLCGSASFTRRLLDQRPTRFRT